MSKSIEKFNGLNGCVASRKDLQHILHLANQEEQIYVANKIENILNSYDDDTFEFEEVNPAIECIPNSILHTLQYDDLNEIEDFNGLQKPVSPNEIYQTITDLIINTIKEVGFLPWQKEWKGTGLPTARNYVTENPYTGINAMILPYEEIELNGKKVIVEPKTKDVYFLTFNQIQKLGATLKKGSKGRMVTYFNFVYNFENPAKGLKLTTSSASDLANFVKKNNLTEAETKESLSQFPILKYYRVFKADDCENLPKKEPKKVNATPNEIGEKIIDLYPKSPKIYIGKEDRAFYRGGGSDAVYMPKVTAFSEESFYYCTFFHELIHSTGHYSRLDRVMIGDKNSTEYAFEELIAELGAVYLCAESGILFRTLENSAKYLRGWNRRLIGKLEEDNKFFFRASAQAQKASNYILDLDEKGIPAYRKFFEKVEVKSASNDKKTDSVTEVQKKTAIKTVKASTKTKKVFKPTSKDVSKVKVEVSVVKYANGTFRVQIFDKSYMDFPSTQNEILENEVDAVKLAKKFAKNGNMIFTGVDYSPFEVGKNISENIKKPVAKPRKKSSKLKVDANGQIALFGAKNNPSIQIKKNSLAERLKSKGNEKREFYKIENKDIATLLGNVEIKPKESVAITIAGGQGSGKTTYAFKLINEFAKYYKVGHASMEEHPESALYEERALKLWNEKAINEVDAPEIKNISDLHDLIMRNDVIVIDSFSKLKELEKSLELDKDFRKKYDGKLFIIIYQLTTNNSMRGGSASQFDGDIIQFVEKNELFSKNYVYNDKNRYQHLDLSTLKYLIASGKLQKEEKPIKEIPSDKKPKKQVQKPNSNSVIFN